MKIHCIQHVPFEGPGAIEEYCAKNNVELTYSHLYKGDKLNNTNADLIVIMGGPMGIYDDVKYPWLKIERNRLKELVQTDQKIIGICLGAQLLADAFGAKVYKNEKSEIGWFPVKKESNEQVITSFQTQEEVLHWHGDTFDLPKGATRIFSTDACLNQGFKKGGVIGLQFHLEMRPQDVETIVENCRSEIVDGQYIQSAEEILKNKSHYTKNQKLIGDMINELLAE